MIRATVEFETEGSMEWTLHTLEELNNLMNIKSIEEVKEMDGFIEELKDSKKTVIDNEPRQDYSYYNRNNIEAWDIIDKVLEFHEGSITNKEAGILYSIQKYLLRYPYKGQASGDLRKVKVYIDQILELYED